jgi:atrial natriuretic peptide receptor A
MGYLVHMNECGDAEGNYTLIARKVLTEGSSKYGLYPIGVFLMPQNSSDLPVRQANTAEKQR